MAFAFLFIGIILIISAARGTLSDLGTLLKSEFTGSNNFFYWLIAIGIIGAIGYNSKAAPFSRAFLALIIIAMILANGGVYENFMEAIQNIPTTSTAGAGTAAGNTVSNTAAPQQPSGSATSGAAATEQSSSGMLNAKGENKFTGPIIDGIQSKVDGILSSGLKSAVGSFLGF